MSEFTTKEWESLCDGCGRCCLNKIEFEDTGEICLTRARCHLLDPKTCQCSDYPNRKKFVKDCIKLSWRNIKRYDYLPETCAYRLVAYGEDLKWWHHLISGSRQTVHEVGVSVKGRTVNEQEIDDLEDYIVDENKFFKEKKNARTQPKTKKIPKR